MPLNHGRSGHGHLVGTTDRTGPEIESGECTAQLESPRESQNPPVAPAAATTTTPAAAAAPQAVSCKVMQMHRQTGPNRVTQN